VPPKVGTAPTLPQSRRADPSGALQDWATDERTQQNWLSGWLTRAYPISGSVSGFVMVLEKQGVIKSAKPARGKRTGKAKAT
jgi:hypothetical protein